MNGSQDSAGSERMTLSETEAALVSVNTEMQMLAQRRARLLKHRQQLTCEPAPADDAGGWPEEPNGEDIQGAYAQPQGEDVAPLPVADVKRWGAQFPWSKEVDRLKKEYFNIDEFRPLQREVINATLSGCDCFVIMPTGGGKSLLYQLPGLISKGVTLVISPLISLMHDQVASLRQFNVEAAMLTGETPKEEQRRIEEELATKSTGHSFRFLFVTPEKIAKAKRFVSRLEKLYRNDALARVVIDECHCCSSWGHDFRPDYLKLGLLRTLFPKTPVLACTATATNRVQKDVREILHMQRLQLFKSSFNRPNLMFEVRSKTASVVADIAEFIKATYPKASGIVYCLSKKDSEKVAEGLVAADISACAYHADMSVRDRERIHKQWGANRTQVIVATIAFGMGINKPDVRFVIHHTLSKSFDAYYQESGRAGRDGDYAHCILYYRAADFSKQSAMAVTSRGNAHALLRRLAAYCQNYTVCRRKLMAEHFGEPYTAAMCDGVCDNCANATNADKPPPKDVTDEAEAILGLLEEQKGCRATLAQLVTEYKGALTKDHTERLVVQMILDEILVESFSQTAYNTVCYLKRGTRKPRNVLLDLPPAAPKNRRRSLSATAQANAELREVLDRLREEIAQAENVTAWTVFEDRILAAIAAAQPTDRKQLEGIMGVQKANKFGARIIAAVNKWLADDNNVGGVTPPSSKRSKAARDGDAEAKSSAKKKAAKDKKDAASQSHTATPAAAAAAASQSILAFLRPQPDEAPDDDFDLAPRHKRTPSAAAAAASSVSASADPNASTSTLLRRSAPAAATPVKSVTEVVISDDEDDAPPPPPPAPPRVTPPTPALPPHRPAAAAAMPPLPTAKSASVATLPVSVATMPPKGGSVATPNAAPPPRPPSISPHKTSLPPPSPQTPPRRKRVIVDSDEERGPEAEETSARAERALASLSTEELALLDTQFLPLGGVSPVRTSPPPAPQGRRSVGVESDDVSRVHTDGEYSSSALDD